MAAVLLLTVSKHKKCVTIWCGETHILCVPDCSVTSQQIKIWRDSDYRNHDDVIRWYNGCQKWGPQKSH